MLSGRCRRYRAVSNLSMVEQDKVASKDVKWFEKVRFEAYFFLLQ